MKKKKTSPALLVTLGILMVMLFVFGFVLRETEFRGNELYGDTPIPALPFVYWFDPDCRKQLHAEEMPEETHMAETDSPVWETAEETVWETASETAADETEPVELYRTVYVKGSVSVDYFDDALFIGDSRTDGLYLYSRFEGADYFSGKGMTMFTLFEKTGRDGKTMLMDLLEGNTYGKIYIMLGINELGSGIDTLTAKFSEVIRQLKVLEPEAIIVIQGNLSIDEKTSASTWYLTKERIHELNAKMSAIADGETVFYLDANPLFCDENGYLRKELSGDGVHLYAKHYADWTAWLCDNAFVPTEILWTEVPVDSE